MTYFNEHGNTMTAAAFHAIYAAKLRRSCGRYAARRYAEKHSTIALYRIACQLLATEGV